MVCNIWIMVPYCDSMDLMRVKFFICDSTMIPTEWRCWNRDLKLYRYYITNLSNFIFCIIYFSCWWTWVTILLAEYMYSRASYASLVVLYAPMWDKIILSIQYQIVVRAIWSLFFYMRIGIWFIGCNVVVAFSFVIEVGSFLILNLNPNFLLFQILFVYFFLNNVPQSIKFWPFFCNKTFYNLVFKEKGLLVLQFLCKTSSIKLLLLKFFIINFLKFNFVNS